MTITITDAAFGLAETICGILLLGCVVAFLFGFVLGVIRDSLIADQDAKIEVLVKSRNGLKGDIKKLEWRLATSEVSANAARDEVEKLTGQIEQVAAIFGWGEVEKEGQS